MLKYWVWLCQLPGLCNESRLALLRHFGSPEEIFCADAQEILLVEGITRETAELLGNKDCSAADQILGECQRLDVRLMTIGDGAYPDRLKSIYDPPCLLYVKGKLPVVDEEMTVAVVGTRACTVYGEACGEKFGYGLAQHGAVVVTGLARGVDAAAVRGALRAGGRPICVLGNGVDVYYPAENRHLYEDVAAVGALVSEYPPGTRPLGTHFPVRNRILAGLSLATVVVEAPLRSGALITARAAAEQGRDVFAVPGPIDAPDSAGCNRLIQEGAGLATRAWDVLESYAPRFPGKLHPEADGPMPEPVAPMPRPAEEEPAHEALPLFSLSQQELTDDQILLLRHMPEQQPLPADDLAEQTDLSIRRVLAALTVLEMEGLVTEHPGKRYTRAVSLRE